MEFKNIVAVFILQIIFSSCLSKIALTKAGALEESVPARYITNEKKKLVFLPMHHIGKKEFYDNAKQIIDSLSQEGYIVYFENVRSVGITDSLQKDSLYRKVRKITSVDLVSVKNSGGYIDTARGTIMGKKIKLISKYKLINQPKTLFPAYDRPEFKNVDANFIQLVNACENKYGKVVLDKYDWETNFGEKYHTKRNKEMSDYFLAGFRNTIITDSILNSKENKIILIYGAKHFDGILENLQSADKNYKEVDKL